MSKKLNRTAIVISIISISIALIGGIPGLIEIYKYLTRSSVEVGFSEGNSFICPISSDKAHLNGKMAVGFYDLYVLGRGSDPTPIKSIDFYLKHKGKWVKGTRFFIRKNRSTDSRGETMECILLANKENVIHIADWNELLKGDGRKIEYLELGHHVRGTISYYFDLKEHEIRKCKKFKFIVRDYFDHEHTYIDVFPEEIFGFLNKNFEVIDRKFDE